MNPIQECCEAWLRMQRIELWLYAQKYYPVKSFIGSFLQKIKGLAVVA
jgi:hypothetical protein